MSTSVFNREIEFYKRDLNIIDAYVRDAATYLSRTTGEAFDKCEAFVKDTTKPGGALEMRDPEVMALSKEKPGERSVVTPTFSQYMDQVIRDDYLISPTFAVYVSPEENLSVISEYLEMNVKKRSKVKKVMFVAKMAGKKLLAEFKKLAQATFKTKNNSMSGAHASPYTPLYNKSAHSTLTSTCRSATSYGNASNEKFIMGNRHYWSPDVVTSNIVSIVNKTDLALVKKAMDLFNLHYPSVEEVMSVITYSTDFYWRNDKAINDIRDLVAGLSELERAAFVYVSDLYHLAQYNPQVVHEFIGRLSKKPTEGIDDVESWMDKADGDLQALASLICTKEVKGRSFDDIKENDPKAYAVVAATVKSVIETLDDYKPLIQAFWVTGNVPPSVAMFPSSIRRTAITSDTDSTIFTVKYWTQWQTGATDMSEQSHNVAYAMVYLASKVVEHILMIMSKNMGVRNHHIKKISMKNEFFFPVFGLTSRAKHYFAYVSAQEGNVYDEFDLELKGVALKNSNCPPDVMEQSNQLIRDIMDNVYYGKNISVRKTLSAVSSIEKKIYTSVKNGGYEYMTTGQIKGESSYTNPASSPYLHYLLWEEVFAPKYGHADPPPYNFVKVNVEADTRAKLAAWLDTIEDKAIAERFRAFLATYQKDGLTQLLLPETIIRSSGIPPEIVQAIDVRKLVFNTMVSFYLVLESLGIYMADDNYTKLVSDYYTEDGPINLLTH